MQSITGLNSNFTSKKSRDDCSFRLFYSLNFLFSKEVRVSVSIYEVNIPTNAVAIRTTKNVIAKLMILSPNNKVVIKPISTKYRREETKS